MHKSNKKGPGYVFKCRLFLLEGASQTPPQKKKKKKKKGREKIEGVAFVPSLELTSQT